jgi:TATA-box binding protein (TBP) (component of TFIID and TFIIIB)
MAVVTPEDARAANIPLPPFYDSSYLQNDRLRACGVHHIRTVNNVLLSITQRVEASSPLSFMQCTGVGARFPAVGMRFPYATVLGFRTGKMVCTGATTFAEAARCAFDHCLLLLDYYGPDDPRCAYTHIQQMRITNTVISGYFDMYLDLKSGVDDGNPHLRTSGKYPGIYVEDALIEQVKPMGCNLAVYPSGAFVITNTTSLNDATSVLEILHKHVAALRVSPGTPVPPQRTPRPGGGGARRTPRKIHQVTFGLAYGAYQMVCFDAS